MNPPCESRIALILLAAGASRRMGSPKALLPWNDTTIVGHHHRTLSAISGHDPWIVIQPNDTPLASELDRMGWPMGRRIVNPLAPQCDMFASIRCGIKTVLDSSETYSHAAIALVDEPLIRPETFRKISQVSFERPKAIIQPIHEGKRGHPVLIPIDLAGQLLESKAYSFRDFLEEHTHERYGVPVEDAGIGIDMDTPETYHQLCTTTMKQGDRT